MPKQLLKLNGEETLLQQTARRVLLGVTATNVVTVTHADYRFEVAGQLHAVHPELAKSVLAEPMGRNTLPAIAWSAARIASRNPKAVVSVFSSDHAISDVAAFESAWVSARAAAQAGYIALFGMTPTEPATGYGYIQASGPIAEIGGGTALQVSRFIEKPTEEVARRLILEGNHFWNGGMFVFRADVFLALVEKLQPAIASAASALAASAAALAPRDDYAALPDLSVDYGILEHARNVAVVPVTMGWSDLGSWESLYQHREKDAADNSIRGEVVAEQANGNLLWSDHGMIAAFGVQNLAVVQTRDATLVCPRNKVADLKQLVAKIKERAPNLTDTHLTVHRPWGTYTILEEGLGFKIKRIVVNPGAKLSMQMHYHRSETWVVVTGTAQVTNGEREFFLEEDQSTYIPKTNRHRLENPGKVPLQIIEIQSGSYLEEDDIVRFGDAYGRS